jgi:hypothetical protein
MEKSPKDGITMRKLFFFCASIASLPLLARPQQGGKPTNSQTQDAPRIVETEYEEKLTQAIQTSVSSMPIVIVPEGNEFYLQIRCRPEQQLVQTLAADCADQSFDKWMGPGNVGNRFDFGNPEDSQVRFPLMKAI